jgi:hypothetical protein
LNAEDRESRWKTPLLSHRPITERDEDDLEARDPAADRPLHRSDDHFVSVGTVKTPINNVYCKLDAHSCTQAVARARELNRI